MSSYDDYKQRFQAESWQPRGTKMNNSPSDPSVIRLEMPERIASEPDLAHKWATSMQPHFTGLVQVNDGIIRNHQTILFCESANTDIRLRAKHELARNAREGNLEAIAVLSQFNESGLAID